MEKNDALLQDLNEQQAQAPETIVQQEPETAEIESRTGLRRKLGGWIKAAIAPERWRKTAVISGAAIVALVVAIVLLARGSATSVAKRYCTAYWGDIRKIEQLSAYDWRNEKLQGYEDEDAFFEDMSEEYDADIRSWQDYYRALNEYGREVLDDYVGKYSAEMDVTKVRDISVDKLRGDLSYHIKKLEEHGSFDADKITAAKKITVKVKLKGEERTVRYTYDMYLVKVSGAWKILTVDSDFGD